MTQDSTLNTFLDQVKVVSNKFWFKVLFMQEMEGLVLLSKRKMYIQWGLTTWKLSILLDDLRDEDPVDMGIDTYNIPSTIDYFDKYVFFHELSHLIDNYKLGIWGGFLMWAKSLKFKHKNRPHELRAREFGRRLARMEKYEALQDIEKELNTRFL